MTQPFISEAGLSAPGEPQLLPPKKLSAVLARIAEWLSFSAVILVPLAFLPDTSQALEFPKQIALLLTVSLASLTWVGSMLVSRTLELRRSVVNLLVLVLVAATAVSALISSAKYISVIGDGGQEYVSLLTTILFAAMFFVIVNIPEKRPFASRAIVALLITGGIVSLYALLRYAGVELIPVATSATFNFVGSTVVLGLYAAVTLVLAASFLLFDDSGKTVLAKRLIAGVCGLLSFAVILVIDFWPVWIAAIIGLLAVIIFAMIKPQAIRRLAWIAVSMAALILSVIMLLVNVPLPIRAPAEVFPSFGQSFSVARDTLYEHPILGSGPGTFNSDFALHRGLELNKSTLWYIQFDRGASFLSTLAATLGLAGMVAWLALIVVVLWKAVAYLVSSREKNHLSWVLVLVLTAAWVASVAGLICYGASLSTLFVFWLLMALLIRAISLNNIELRFQSSPRSALSLTFCFVILIVLCLAGWFVTGTRLYSDLAFVKGVNVNAATQIDAVIASLEKAAKINPQSDNIARNLSQAYIIKIQQIINNPKLDATARDQQIQSLSSAAVKAGREAAMLAPENSQNWAQLGSIYESMIPYVNNASDEAITTYTKNAELDPTSPAPLTALGRVYLAVAGMAALERNQAKDEAAKASVQAKIDKALSSAETQLNKALELKSDYAAASYQLALVKDGQGKTKEAIAGLQKVELSNPTDMGVAFELAMLYYRDNQKDKAQAELERAIAAVPNFANARWLLATILEEKQKWDDAIIQVQAILKDNPDNQTVQQKLKTLQDEKAANAPIVQPGQPSVRFRVRSS